MSIVDFNSSIWVKPWFRRLPPTAKILFIYLWSNNHKNIIGMYQIDIDTIQFETGLTKKQVEDTLCILYPKIKYDVDGEIVWVVNHVKHQFMRTASISPKIVIGIEKALISLGNHSFVKEFIEKYDTLSIGYIYPPGGGEGVRCIGEGEGKEDEVVKNEDDRIGSFSEVWNRYPNKDGKKQAEKSFKASVRSKQDWDDINKALENYLKSDRVMKGFVKNGSTWFANWRDWIEITNMPAIDEVEAKRQRRLKILEDANRQNIS